METASYGGVAFKLFLAFIFAPFFMRSSITSRRTVPECDAIAESTLPILI